MKESRIYSEDVAKFYGVEGSNVVYNDITSPTIKGLFVKQMGAYIEKGIISKKEANNIYTSMKLSHGDNAICFDEFLFASYSGAQKNLRVNPIWLIFNERGEFGRYVTSLYGDYSSRLEVTYLSSYNEMSIVLVTEIYEGIVHGYGEAKLEKDYETKRFCIIKKDDFYY